MAHAFGLIEHLCVAGALVGCVYTVVVTIAVISFRSPVRAAPTSCPPVTVLKPLHGAEPGLLTRLAAFCTQNYGGTVQLVFGVQSASDPAIEVVRQLQARFANVSIAMEIDPREHGSNRKVSNLINMLPLARHDILVMSDSDIEVGPDYLAQVIANLEQPGVGAATCLYHGLAEASVASGIAALAINTHFLPQAVAALRLHLAKPCFGGTIAIRRHMLNEIGGLRAFVDMLAEDYAIGEAVRRAGFDIAFAPASIGHACFDAGSRGMLSRQLRVARTIKVIEPIGYVGTVIAHPFALASIGALLGASGGAALMACTLTARIVLCACVERAFRLPRQPYWLIPLHDLVAFAIYIASFTGTTVTWRGYRYQVASDGTMAQQATRVG